VGAVEERLAGGRRLCAAGGARGVGRWVAVRCRWRVAGCARAVTGVAVAPQPAHTNRPVRGRVVVQARVVVVVIARRRPRPKSSSKRSHAYGREEAPSSMSATSNHGQEGQADRFFQCLPLPRVSHAAVLYRQPAGACSAGSGAQQVGSAAACQGRVVGVRSASGGG